MNVIRLTSDRGQPVAFVDEVIATGAMKDIYASPDKTYVAGFFRDAPDAALRDRLREITTRYRSNLFDKEGGDFWKDYFCWPTDTVQHWGRIGVVMPFYAANFFFEYGLRNDDMLNIRGRDKEGKWFVSASNREKYLDAREKCNWLTHLQICLSIARAVRRLHMAGPLLGGLFDRAFITGLHDPDRRPAPAGWENVLVRTLDMIQPCSMPCDMGWFIFDNTRAPVCPHCGTRYRGSLPVLNLYSSRTQGSFHPDNHRLMVWDGQSLFAWHVNRELFPNEHLEPAMKQCVSYFQRRRGDWYLVNEKMPGIRNLPTGTQIAIGGSVKLEDGKQVLLSPEDGGRLVQVQMAGTDRAHDWAHDWAHDRAHDWACGKPGRSSPVWRRSAM